MLDIEETNGLWLLGGFIGIFLSLLVLFLFVPAIWMNPSAHLILQSVFTVVVVYTLFMITRSALVLFIGLTLSFLYIYFGAYSVYASSMETLYSAYAFYAALLAFAILVSIRKVLLSKRINSTLVCGAIIIYLFSGIFWAKLYFLVDGQTPGSFKGIEQVDPKSSDLTTGYNVQFDFIYYSFSTLATAGVGDIVPLNRFAKSLTMLEAMYGQLYVAIVIAKLVSVWQQSPVKSRESL